MMRYILITILVGLSYKISAKELLVKFYSDEIKIEYDEKINIKYSVKANDKSIISFYDQVEKMPYQGLVEQLENHGKTYGLTDWFYYKMILAVSKEILSENDENAKVAFCWFLLNKLDYNCSIRFVKGNKISLYIYSKDQVFNTYFKVGNKKYISIEDSRRTKDSGVSYLRFSPNSKGRPFSFSLKSLPKFATPEFLNREIIFEANKQFDTLNVIVNKTNIDALQDLPQLEVQEYFKLSPSDSCKKTLLSFFSERTKGMKDSAVVRYLLSFVRLGFKFEGDAISFGKEKPMVAEEVLYYPTADCEDKSALFFYLVKELIHVDMLVLDYPKHVNVAVLLDKSYGNPLVYKRKRYSICETNVLGDSKNAGIGYSTVYEKYPNPKIIYEYHPKKK